MKYFNYILVLLGALIAVYSKITGDKNQYILMAGIVILMAGIYRISRNISSKKDKGNYPSTPQ